MRFLVRRFRFNRLACCLLVIAAPIALCVTNALGADPPAESSLHNGSVTIYRDTWGVPHIYAKTPAEGIYGLGYAQAHDRLDDIYRNLRTGLGRMSEAFGKKFVDQDYIMRLCRNEELARSYWKTAPPEVKNATIGYVAGVERYIAEHPEKVPAFAFKLEPWQVLTVGRAMTLNWPLGTIKDDLEHGLRKDAAAAKHLPMRSNQWCVAPSRSADKVAILLADPHLDWGGMAVMYEARVHAGDLHMNGFFLVGGPTLGIGHNEHVGWALTTGGPDTSDVYKMKFRMSPKPQYEYDGKWRDAKMTFISFDVKDGSTVIRPALYTHLGPIIKAPDSKTGVAYVGASPYFDAMGLAEQFYKMAMARDVHEVYDALGMNQYNEQNVMFADDKGSIAYVRNGATPIRPAGYDWSAPVPGTSSATAWKGIHPIDDLVHIFNPPQGYMQNCNISPANMMIGSSMTPDKYPSYIYNVSWDDNNPRGKRIVELLNPDHCVTKDQAISFTTDVKDILADMWKATLRTAVDAAGSERMKDPEFAAAVAAIEDWDGRYLPEYKATAVYKFWRLKCGKSVDLSPLAHKKPLDDAANKKLVDLLAETIAEMKTRYGKWDVAWGDIHKVGRGGQYFPVGGCDYDSGDKGANFSETLFDVKSKEDPKHPGRYVAYNGSMATILMFFHKDGVRSFTVTPWGQNSDPKSPHYMDQGEKLYSKRQMKPTWWSEAELQKHVESKTVLEIH
ncbi:MAG TPA: penicillin acylase family protein [Planctomycetaceae bacterium]|nr:penicillin acylase family protein [Planctomycetaceae bacterium]